MARAGWPQVSIHAPHVGRDLPNPGASTLGGVFQSTRPTWGATNQWVSILPRLDVFQSTRPTWGATMTNQLNAGVDEVSIHAPHVGRDPATCSSCRCRIRFNPRAPR